MSIRRNDRRYASRQCRRRPHTSKHYNAPQPNLRDRDERWQERPPSLAFRTIDRARVVCAFALGEAARVAMPVQQSFAPPCKCEITHGLHRTAVESCEPVMHHIRSHTQTQKTPRAGYGSSGVAHCTQSRRQVAVCTTHMSVHTSYCCCWLWLCTVRCGALRLRRVSRVTTDFVIRISRELSAVSFRQVSNSSRSKT